GAPPAAEVPAGWVGGPPGSPKTELPGRVGSSLTGAPSASAGRGDSSPISTAPGRPPRRRRVTTVGGVPDEKGRVMGDARALGAEALGTFWLVLGGCGSAVLAAQFGDGLGIGLLGVSLAFGLTVVTGAYALGHL